MTIWEFSKPCRRGQRTEDGHCSITASIGSFIMEFGDDEYENGAFWLVTPRGFHRLYEDSRWPRGCGDYKEAVNR